MTYLVYLLVCFVIGWCLRILVDHCKASMETRKWNKERARIDERLKPWFEHVMKTKGASA